MFVMVLVGTVGLNHALGWYFDPMRQIDRTTAIVATVRPPSPPGQPRRALPSPTDEELALLGAADPAIQVQGAETLLARAVTPDLVRTVDAALLRQPDPRLERLLVCIKSRFEGPEILEFLLARLPSAPKELDWNMRPDVSCVLEVLVERIMDAPERIAAALMPAVYASNGSTRHKVLGAFRTIDLRSVPAALVAEAGGTGRPRRREALAAVMALGAIRHHPALVADAVRDPHTSAVVMEDLRSDPHPNAARIVATVWAERSFETQYEQLARAREGVHHDVSAALVEIVGMSSTPERERVAAARQLAMLAEVGALHELRTIASTLDSGELKTTVDATIDVLRERRKTGARDQMRALPR